MVGADRLTTRRQLVNYRDIQIAIECHGKGSGYGCGCHHKDVWRLLILCPEACSLLHTETVLLVDYHIAKICELHTILDQGMCADEDVHLARGYALQGVASLGSLR